MDERARLSRNAQRLGELHTAFARRIRRVLAALEAKGYRPRIQDAWRSPADQLKAFARGTSKLKFGFHNVTRANGRPEALAVDILDDDFPLNPRGDYLLQLAAASGRVQCRTGIAWGLPPALAKAVADAVANGAWRARIKIGWDPTHVEPADLTLAAAKAGKRPPPHVGAATRRRPHRGKKKPRSGR